MKYHIYSTIARYLLGQLRKYHKDAPKLLVYSKDFIGEEVYSYGVYEKHDIKTILLALDFDPKRHNMLDIGANIGNHTVQFSNHFGHVFSFEPNPVLFEVLKLNTLGRNNVTNHNFGISDEESTAYLVIPEFNAGGGHIAADPEDKSHPITLKALDTGFKEDFALIKIDVEGHEANALRGMKQLILKNKPIICFELINREDEGKELIDTIRDMGYERFYIPKEPGISSKSGKPRFSKQFLYGLFFKRKYVLEQINTFNRPFYNLVICCHPESTHQIRKEILRK